MPLLQLSCKCGNQWEALKTFSTNDPTVDNCPRCGSADPIRRYDSPALQLKGYDYANADPLEKEMALSNKRKIEADAEKHLSGEERHVVPKGTPIEYRPVVPEHLRKRLF